MGDIVMKGSGNRRELLKTLNIITHALWQLLSTGTVQFFSYKYSMIKMDEEYSSTPSRGVILCHLQANWVCVRGRHGLEQQREAYGPEKPQSYHRVYSVVTVCQVSDSVPCLLFHLLLTSVSLCTCL